MPFVRYRSISLRAMKRVEPTVFKSIRVLVLLQGVEAPYSN